MYIEIKKYIFCLQNNHLYASLIEANKLPFEQNQNSLNL